MPATKTPRLYAVRVSGIHGKGVFATAKIRKGTRIIEYRGQRASWEDAIERPASDPDDPNHTFFFELSDGRVIDGNVRGNAARWINHSCDPNCESVEEEDGRVYIEARRKVKAEEELSYDYRLSLDGKIGKKELAEYACSCGAKKCRGSLLARAAKKQKKRARKKKK